MMPKMPPKATSAKAQAPDPRRLYKWTKCSRDYRKQHPACQRCEYLKTLTIQSYERLSVHHIRMAVNNKDLFYDWENLLTLCIPCHKHFDDLERAGEIEQSESEGMEIKESC